MLAAPAYAADHTISDARSQLTTSGALWSQSAGGSHDVNSYDTVTWHIKYDNQRGITGYGQSYWKFGSGGAVYEDQATYHHFDKKDTWETDFTLGVNAGTLDLYRYHRYEQDGGMIWETSWTGYDLQ